jgi:hypothetical protein
MGRGDVNNAATCNPGIYNIEATAKLLGVKADADWMLSGQQYSI